MDAANTGNDTIVTESKAIEQVLERLKAHYTGTEPAAVGHLAFDDVGVGAWSAGWQEPLQQFTAGVGEGLFQP